MNTAFAQVALKLGSGRLHHYAGLFGFNETPSLPLEAAFLLRPTPLDEVAAVARRGDVMPQKSTYFYPKLTSGLLFHPLD